MAARNHLSKIVLVSLCALIIGVTVEESNQILSKRSLADCLGKCSRLDSFKSKVSILRFSCFHQCLKTSKATDQQALTGQIFKQRTRKSLPPVPNCPDSSPDQTVDWTPSEVNVSFGQYQNTSHWYANVSWTPLNDSYGNWTGILVRLAIIKANASHYGVICSVHPKNHSFVNINISSYNYQYPDPIFMVVHGFPYSPAGDIVDMNGFEPIRPSPPSVTSVVWTTMTTGNSQETGLDNITAYASISIGVLVGLALVTGILTYFLCSRKSNSSPPDFRSEFEYHAFIIYNKEDSGWVITKLLPLLEEKHHLKCCIHYRDFMPGTPYHDSMADSVYKSYKVIAVLSSNFLNSNYCRYELDLAKYRLLNKRDDSLIMIRIDKMDYKKLPRVLKKRNFIDYSNPLEKPFWEEKLVKFMDVPNDPNAIVQQNNDNNNNDDDHVVIQVNNSAKFDFSRLNSTTSNATEISIVTLNQEMDAD